MATLTPSAGAPCPPPVRFYRPLTVKDPSGAMSVDGVGRGDLFEAVEVGPDSDWDEFYLFANGKQPPSPDLASYGPDGNPLRNYFSDAIHVSVGNPYVGPLRGPIVACLPLAVYTQDGERQAGYIPPQAAYLPGREWCLDLKFHRVNPLWFARQRPQKRIGAEMANYGGTVAETTLLYMPAMGREDFLLAYSALSIVAGTVTLRIYGGTFGAGFGGSTMEKLLASPTIVAAGAEAYEYEGKFDYYRVSGQRAGVTAATRLSIAAHTRDK